MVELDDPRIAYQYRNHSLWLFPPEERKGIKHFLNVYLNLVVPSETQLDSFAIPLKSVSTWLHVSVHDLQKMMTIAHKIPNRDFEVRRRQLWINSRTLSQLLQMLPWEHPVGIAARNYFATMDHAYRNYAGETLRRRNRLERELSLEEDNLDDPQYVKGTPASAVWDAKIKGLDGTTYITIGITSNMNTTFQRFRLKKNELVADLPTDGAKAWRDIQKRNGWTDADHPRPSEDD
jgi:hypothetical protein